MPPHRFRKVIEDDEEEISITNATTTSMILDEEVESKQLVRVNKLKAEKKGGVKRKIVDDSEDDSEEDLDERLELTDDDDDIESLSSIDSQIEQADDDDEEMEDISQNNRLVEIEKAILGKLDGKSCDQQLIIQSIEMKNFKSYKDHTLVGPFTTGLNCIIGSNGSGKSNIIDSICFVLGFESKELRAKNLDYLINDQCPPNEESFVSINFNVISNGNGCIKKFSIQRKIKRNDHSSSYYLSTPNEESKKITKKQVRELLNEYGIDFDYPDRFIVMQHNTIKMVKQNPLEMLFHLEKLFGTDRVQTEIKQVQDDITKLRSDMQLHEKEKDDCEKDLELLKPIVENYHTFKRLEKKVEDTKTAIKESELKCLTFKLDKCKKELKEASSQLSILESSQSNSRTEMQQVDGEINQQTRKLDDVEKEIEIRKHSISKIQKSLLKLRVENDTQNQKVQHLETELEKSSRESTYLIEENNKLNSSISNTEEAIKDLEANIDIERKEVEQLTSNIDEKSQNLLLDLHKELDELVSYPSYLLFTSRLDESKKLKEKIANLYQLLNQKTEEELLLKQSIEENVNLMKLVNTETDILEADMQKVQESIDSKKKERNIIEDEIFEIESNSLQIIESGGTQFFETLKKVKSEVVGYFGTITEIYRISDQKYTVCANAVLSPYLKNTVVVSSREAALKVVNIFEKDRAGLVSCEILNEVKSFSIHSDNTPIELKPLIEAIECEPQYRQLLERHTQGWFISDSTETAIKYSNHNGIRRNIVTLDGKLFKSFGEISCNFQKEATSRQLGTQYSRVNSNNIENNKDIESLPILKKNSLDLQTECDQLLISIHEIKQKISEKKSLTKKYQSQNKQLRSSISSLSRKLTSIKKDLEHQNETLESVVLSQSEEKAFLDLEEQKNGLETKIISIETVNNNGCILSTLKKSLSEKQKEYADLYNFKENQKQKLNQTSLLLSNIASKREQHKKELDNLRKESMHEELESLESEFTSIKKKKQKLESKKEDYCNRLKELRRNCKKTAQTIIEKDDQISRKTQEKESVQQEIEELKSSIRKLSNEAYIRVEKNFDLELEEKKRLKLLSEVKYTSSELENMQDSVDNDCLEKQSQSKRKLAFSNKKLNSINQKIDKLEQLESSFLNLRYELFHKVISKVNENLSQIFRDLNNNSNCYISFYEDKKTLFEKGVNIYCKYDMEWKEFGKLSGGQKNLVCSVLSIALMRCFSTSICIFDELCSSLDTINVEKLAKLIKCNAIETQFICISFKFYEKADNIIGVYHQNGVSCTVPFSNK